MARLGVESLERRSLLSAGLGDPLRLRGAGFPIIPGDRGAQVGHTAGPHRPTRSEFEQTVHTAVAAYVYGYPLVLMKVTELSMLLGAHATTNQFINVKAVPPAGPISVPRPNTDTLYSNAWLDLSQGPVVLHVPDTQGRYYLMQMLDAYTNTFADPGTRTMGTKAQDFVIIGPGWHGALPPGATPIQAPTDLVWILGRTQVNASDPNDVRAVNAIQDQYTLTPLGGTPTPPATAPIGVPPGGQSPPTPAEIVAHLNGATFFQILSGLMCDNPAPPRDAPALRHFQTIGFEPCQPFQPTPTVAAALQFVPSIAQGRILARSQHLGPNVNGWQIILKNVGSYGVHYADRAAIAVTGLGANLPQDSVYPSTSVDGQGRSLDGTNNYVLEFAPGRTPPVDAFWSLTLYDQGGYFVPNPLNRYAIHGGDPLHYNPDGSLDIFIQQSAPSDPALMNNWLPAPPGPFNLTLRLYSPQPSVLNGHWTPPPVRANRA